MEMETTAKHRLNNAFITLRRAVRRIRYPGSDDIDRFFTSAEIGSANVMRPLLEILGFLFLGGYSKHIARLVSTENRDIFAASSDIEFAKEIFVLLPKLFNYRPRLSVTQFIGENSNRHSSKAPVGRNNNFAPTKFLEQKIKLVVACIDLVAAKHSAFLRAEHTCPKVMGSPRLHRSVKLKGNAKHQSSQARRTQIPQQRQMRTVARRGPVDSEPAVPLARSVVPLPHQHPSPHGSTGITESISSSEDNCQEPPLTDITSSSQNDDKDRIVTASDLGSENLLQHHPSIVDRADSRLHGNTTPDFEAKASSSGTESQQIALLREIQTTMMGSMRRLEQRVDDICEQFGARISILEARWSTADTFVDAVESTEATIADSPRTPQKISAAAEDNSVTPARNCPRTPPGKSSGSVGDNFKCDIHDGSDYAWPMDLALY